MRRGEIWIARLNPNVGAEMGKVRPVVILMEPLFLETGSPVVLAAPPHQHHVRRGAGLLQMMQPR